MDMSGGKTLVPDFFIIGAPKCGTTALYEYLSTHPDTFMPENKEPHFFADDMYVRDTGIQRRMTSPECYAALFKDATQDQTTGEGSTWYLASERAIPSILAVNPAARFIVMLRNPIEMLQSLHRHFLRKLYEDVEDIERAWALQPLRREGKMLPPYCPDPKMLDYEFACNFPLQLRRLFSAASSDQIQIHLYEEFFSDPRQGYLDTLAFLGLQDDGRSAFERHNPNRRLRNRLLYKLATYKPFPVNLVYPALKRATNAFGLRPGKALFERNIVVETRRRPDPVFLARLHAYFEPQINELENLLGRRLEHWRGISTADKP